MLFFETKHSISRVTTNQHFFDTSVLRKKNCRVLLCGDYSFLIDLSRPIPRPKNGTEISMNYLGCDNARSERLSHPSPSLSFLFEDRSKNYRNLCDASFSVKFLEMNSQEAVAPLFFVVESNNF